jgi:hypothetical protein
MKRKLLFGAAVVLLVLSFAGCNLIGLVDPIVGTWAQTSINGTQPLLSTTFKYTATTYSGSTSGVNAYNGSWTRSGAVYTMVGSFFGFVPTTVTLTPTFSDWNNTLTFTDGNNDIEVYTRQ